MIVAAGVRGDLFQIVGSRRRVSPSRGSAWGRQAGSATAEIWMVQGHGSCWGQGISWSELRQHTAKGGNCGQEFDPAGAAGL